MRPIILLAVLLTFAFSANAQNLNIRLGGNASLGATLTTVQSGNITSDEDTSAVLATMIPITVDYYITDYLSVSAGFKAGSWLNEDPNDNSVTIKKKSIKQLLLGFKLLPVHKDNFELYLGYDLGIGGFQTVKEYNNLIFIKEEQKWGGISNNINLGTNFYFGGKFGMYFQLGYTGYNLGLKEFTTNGDDLMTTYDLSADMAVKGVQVELGFCFKLNN